MNLKPIGQERVEKELTKALLCVEKLNVFYSKPQSETTKKRIESKQKKLKRAKQKLVFLSTKARDKVTRFYASNALKEIASRI